MTRLCTFIYNTANKDVMLKKSQFQACMDDNNLKKSRLATHCKNMTESPVLLCGAVIASLFLVRKGKFSTLRKLVMLKRFTDNFMASNTTDNTTSEAAKNPQTKAHT